MSKKLPKFLGSSVNSEQISLTFKGIAVGLIPVIILLSKTFGSGENLDEKTLTDLVDSVGDVIITAGTLVSAVMVAVGLIRKIAVSLNIIKPKP